MSNHECEHNEMVSTGDPEYAWKCADCGHIYGQAPIPTDTK